MEQFLWFVISLAHLLAIIWAILVAVLSKKEDDKTKEYSVREMEKRTYEDHMNLMPIPQSEINKNKNLIQNWGWSPRVVD